LEDDGGMDLRTFGISDLQGCLAVAESAGCSREGLEAHLEKMDAPFFVLVHEDRVLGCGGFRIAGGEAWLEWGMVSREVWRQGLGRYLLMWRLKEIGRVAPGVEFVRAHVPEEIQGFYVKQGFRLGAEGEVVKRLAVCG
jgi:GNAT superfamily N-acetyltransferase